MRLFEIFEVINQSLLEANLQINRMVRLHPEYWVNLYTSIQNTGEVEIDHGRATVKVKSPQAVAKEMKEIWNGASPGDEDVYRKLRQFRIPTQDGKKIPLGRVFKNRDVKGVSDDFNIGDIGEICLGVACAAKIVNRGEEITEEHFLDLAKQFSIATHKKKSSRTASFSSQIEHGTGKQDDLAVTITTPARSIISFWGEFINDLPSAPPDVRGTIASAISFANQSPRVQSGYAYIRSDLNRNLVEINSMGTENQKGTKVDLIMSIDNQRKTLISAKAGRSQLGQASSKDWSSPESFFRLVFGLNINKYRSKWSDDSKSNVKVLSEIFQNEVYPWLESMTRGDDTQKEKKLVRQVTKGLVHYANNASENDDTGIIDIVKLSTVPSSPGYRLMRIDHTLEDALEQVNLTARMTRNRQGVVVAGVLDGKEEILFQARSYWQKNGTARTVIEGGDLLDRLAEIQEEKEEEKKKEETA